MCKDKTNANLKFYNKTCMYADSEKEKKTKVRKTFIPKNKTKEICYFIYISVYRNCLIVILHIKHLKYLVMLVYAIYIIKNE